jgi:hypothetical protein
MDKKKILTPFYVPIIRFLLITLCSLVFIYPIEIMKIRSLYTIMILTTIILAAYTYYNIYNRNNFGIKW